MEQMTHFESFLVGVSVVLFIFGFDAFIKNVFLKGFRSGHGNKLENVTQ